MRDKKQNKNVNKGNEIYTKAKLRVEGIFVVLRIRNVPNK